MTSRDKAGALTEKAECGSAQIDMVGGKWSKYAEPGRSAGGSQKREPEGCRLHSRYALANRLRMGVFGQGSQL